jgi:hypothetical protein
MSHRRFSDDGFARAWAAFARHDAAQVVPPALDVRVRHSVAARCDAAGPEVVPQRPLATARVVVAVAACLVAAVAAGWLSVAGRRASIEAPLPDAPVTERTLAAVAIALPAALDVPAPRPVAASAPVRRQSPRPAPAMASADGPLQVIRVRIAASALDALGVTVAGPIAPGLVDVDLVVSADGWPMEVRRIRPVTADGPLQ